MLVPCRNCGKEVGEVADICFHCGTKIPNRKKKREENICLGITIIMIVVFIKNDDWFNKDSFFPEWFPILIAFIGIVYIVWVVFKAITDSFK